MVCVAGGFEALDAGEAGQFNHGTERLSGETLSPCILGEGIASDGVCGRLEGEAGAAEERFGAIIQSKSEVGTGGPVLPFGIAPCDEGLRVCNGAMVGPTEIARDCGVGRVAAEDGLRIGEGRLAEKQAGGLDGFWSFQCADSQRRILSRIMQLL